jgi:membrane protein implicated in regulation of membrane protease activity
MSQPDNPTPTLQHTGGEIAMILIGIVLLLPGLCSLILAVGSISEWRSSDPILRALIGLWVVCFIVSGVGIALIWLARRNARKRTSVTSPSNNNPVQ